MQKRPRLGGDDVDLLAGVVRGTHHAERGAVARGRQRARVAVGEHGGARLEQGSAEFAECAVAGDVLVIDRDRLLAQHLAHHLGAAPARAREGAAHALDRPKQIHRGRPRRSKATADAIEGAAGVALGRLRHPERDAHRGGHADRRRAAHHHVLDGARDIAMIAIHAVHLLQRQEPLVEEHDGTIAPLDRSNHSRSPALHTFEVMRGQGSFAARRWRAALISPVQSLPGACGGRCALIIRAVRARCAPRFDARLRSTTRR
jgi:hypothetical protein